jgi:mannose-6-phosphate isomerase-like protein (cupin superfamily)
VTEKKSLEKIEVNEQILALIVRHRYNKPGYNFISPTEFPLQLGVSIRKKGEFVRPHEHIPFKELYNIPVQEFLYIKSGKVRISLFYTKKRFKTIELKQGDMILLNCGHEVKFLKDTKLVEVKQGPYRGKDAEKEYFE